MSARAASAPGAGVLDRLQVLRSAPTPLRGAPAATWTPSPRTGVGPLRVPGPGLQPSSHDTTTTRTDPAGSTLARPDFGPKDGVHLKHAALAKHDLDRSAVDGLEAHLEHSLSASRRQFEPPPPKVSVRVHRIHIGVDVHGEDIGLGSPHRVRERQRRSSLSDDGCPLLGHNPRTTNPTGK